jgi:hypothetical protein
MKHAFVVFGGSTYSTKLQREANWMRVIGPDGREVFGYDQLSATDPDAALRRLQVWSNLALFQTFSAMANVVGSTILDDLRDLDERRAEVQGLPRPDTGAVEVYSPFSANLVVRGGGTQHLIIATRRVIEQDARWVQIRDQNRLLSFGRYGTP